VPAGTGVVVGFYPTARGATRHAVVGLRPAARGTPFRADRPRRVRRSMCKGFQLVLWM